MRYINLDGSEFDGPVFHPQMEVAGIGGRTYRTVFSGTGAALYRVELAVDDNGHFIWTQEGEKE